MEVLLKKKRKKLAHIIGLDESNLTEERAIDSISDIEKKLKDILKLHIGEANSISPYDLFVKVYGIAPTELDVYKRSYWWGIIVRTLQRLRSSNALFSVVRNHKVFVLQSESELAKVKKRISNHIKALNRIKGNAKVWGREQKWKQL